MKMQIAAYNRLQSRFSFLRELHPTTNFKTEESAEKLLHQYPNNLEESLPKEMIR